MERGFIKIYRKVLDNLLFYNPTRLQLFLYLLLKANHKPNKVFGIELVRGQHITGRKILADNLKSNENTVYKNLKWLQKNELILLNSNNKRTIVTICNYDSYQNIKTAKEQRGNSKVTTKEQQSNTNKNKKNEKNDKEIKLSDFEKAFKNFLKMRKKIKKPLIEEVQDLILKKLSGLTKIESEQIEILNNSTIHGWQGVYPLKNNTNKGLQNIQKINKELDEEWLDS